MVKYNVLFKSDNTTKSVTPAGLKFTKEELEDAVGGTFNLIPCNDDELFFVVNKAINEQPESLRYNIIANYLYRRYVGEDKELRGDILLCRREQLEVCHIIFFSGSIKQTDSLSDVTVVD